jgi:hypothetical protein
VQAAQRVAPAAFSVRQYGQIIVGSFLRPLPTRGGAGYFERPKAATQKLLPCRSGTVRARLRDRP